MIETVKGWIRLDFNSLTKADITSLIPDRKKDAHKGDFGRILLMCGSRGYTGAAALSAMGALRSGAGLVYLAVPESIYEIEASKLLEPIVIPMPEYDGKLSVDAIKSISELLPKMDAVLVGPGLGASKETEQVVVWLLQNYEGPVVIDADGINVLRSHRNILRGRRGTTVLTPHAGEFARIGGSGGSDRGNAAAAMAKELGVIVVLKGHNTIITDGSSGFINPTGNPGMAVGGSGDVLAGMITAFIGQGIAPIDAAACAVWLHGAAGDICAQEIGQYGMLPSDMLKVLPRLLK